MRQQTRVGVAGAGNWGTKLLRNCADTGVLHAVYDPDLARLAEVRRQFPNVATAASFSGLVSAVDAVVIAAPAPLHTDLALEAIGAGRHVLIEKPLALNSEDARRIVEAADRKGVRAIVGHVLLYHPAIGALLEQVEAGSIGSVRHVRSRRLNLGRIRDHESVWWSFAPHDVALVLAVLGEGPVRASAAMECLRETPLADFAYADLEFPSGASAHIEVSWLDPNRSSRLDVFGTAGLLSFEDSRSGASLMRRTIRVTPELETCSGEPELLPFASGEPLRLELEAFLAAASDGRPTPTDARHGAEVVRVLEWIDSIARSNLTAATT
jgi:UDP-2-acetamido-3-amino-2,3-dideoxy-glucuronate N-acetyltransferase